MLNSNPSRSRGFTKGSRPFFTPRGSKIAPMYLLHILPSLASQKLNYKYSMIVSVWHKLNHYNSWNNKDTSNLNITYESLCFGIYRYLNKKLQNGCFLPLHMLLIAWVYQQWFWILCSPKLFLLHFLPICQAYLFAKHKMLFLVLC